MSDLKQQLGNAIRAKRAELSISQEELADRSGLHRTYVSGLERGVRNPSLESIQKLAAALELSVSNLFNRAGLSPEEGSLVEILLVEDNPWDVEMTLKAFQKSGIENPVNVLRDGVAALDFLLAKGAYSHRSGHPLPGVVLLDLNLPKLGGLEVLQQIRKDPRTKDLPVIVLTSSAEQQDDSICRRLGVETYIVKPVKIPELINATPNLPLKWRLIGA